MTLSQCTIGAEEIAAALDWTKPYFLRKVGDLTDNQGMPHRIPGSRSKGGRWHRAAIETWLAGYDEKKRAALRGEDEQEAISADRFSLYLAYVNPSPIGGRSGPQLIVDNTRARA